jgi:trk system potassium uptake protein TrkH
LPLLRGVQNWWRRLSPPALFAVSFSVLITVGTLGLLFLPNLYTGPHLPFIDALFTATSAACVTGLSVVNTASYFTFWGQLWILLIIQLGGLGLISLTTVIIGSMGRRLALHTEVMAVPSLEEQHGSDLIHLASGVMKFTFAVEFVFTLFLWLQWREDFGALEAFWHAAFHAVSAFCNAGFSTFTNSLEDYALRPDILMPISMLVVIGGIGYLSGEELLRWWRARTTGPARLSSHTYAALWVTIILLVGGALFFAALEWRGVLQAMPFSDRLTNAWFMSVTARTAGFNSVAYESISVQSGMVTILLMFIGGSPGSTAGGIKTTAIAVLVAMAWSRIRGRRYVELHNRAIPDATVERTVSLVFLFALTIGTAFFCLTFSEAIGAAHTRDNILPLFFETVSATATVGLSMGVSTQLTPLGKFIIVLCMFVGRVGPLAFFAAISLRGGKLPAGFRPAREDLIVG